MNLAPESSSRESRPQKVSTENKSWKLASDPRKLYITHDDRQEATNSVRPVYSRTMSTPLYFPHQACCILKANVDSAFNVTARYLANKSWRIRLMDLIGTRRTRTSNENPNGNFKWEPKLWNPKVGFQTSRCERELRRWKREWNSFCRLPIGLVPQ